MSFKEKVIGAAIIAASWMGFSPQQAGATTSTEMQGKTKIEKVFGWNIKGDLNRGLHRAIENKKREIARDVEHSVQGVGASTGNGATGEIVTDNLRGLVRYASGRDSHFQFRVSARAQRKAREQIIGEINKPRGNVGSGSQYQEVSTTRQKPMSEREIAEAERAAARAAERAAKKSQNNSYSQTQTRSQAKPSSLDQRRARAEQIKTGKTAEAQVETAAETKTDSQKKILSTKRTVLFNANQGHSR